MNRCGLQTRGPERHWVCDPQHARFMESGMRPSSGAETGEGHAAVKASSALHHSEVAATEDAATLCSTDTEPLPALRFRQSLDHERSEIGIDPCLARRTAGRRRIYDTSRFGQ